MNSLASPWYSFGGSSGNNNTSKWTENARPCAQTRRRLTVRNRRHVAGANRRKKAGDGARCNVKKTGGSSVECQLNNKTDEWLVVCGTNEIPLSTSSPISDRRIERSVHSEQTTTTVVTSSTTDSSPSVLDTDDAVIHASSTVLSFPAKTYPDTWRKLLRTRRLPPGREVLGLHSTPYRYNLADIDRVTLNISDVPRPEPVDTWCPVLAWEKRLARKCKDNENNGAEPANTDPEPSTDDKNQVKDDDFTPPVAREDERNEENMKERGNNVLPAINLSGRMIQTKAHATKSIGQVRSRLLGVPRNTNHVTSQRDDFQTRRDQFQSYNVVKDIEIIEPRATAMKLEVITNGETRIGVAASRTSKDGHQQEKGVGKEQMSMVQADPTIDLKNVLPPLKVEVKDESPKKKCRSDEYRHRNVKLPKVNNPDRGHVTTTYNYQGNTSKLTKIKSCSLKDLTDISNDKPRAHLAATSTDRTWRDQLEKSVIDLNSYDMFARKSTRKYNTAKTIGMLILTKHGSPPTAVHQLASRPCSQQPSVCETSSDDCRHYDVISDDTDTLDAPPSQHVGVREADLTVNNNNNNNQADRG